MKHFSFAAIVFAFISIFSTENLFSQNQPFWSNNGNTVGSTDFFGSTNSQSLLFKTSNLERLRITSGGFVGIGTTTPQYLFDCNGDARFNGTIYANGIVLATRMQADTFKSTSYISVNNTLHFSGGTLNNIYTSSGDLRFQSNIGNSGNTLFNVGTNGNVGVGIFSPLYKVDVLGAVRVSDRIYVHRIVPLPGDSEIHFGDSSVSINAYTNTIMSQPSGANLGLGLGFDYTTRVYGYRSLAIGYKVISHVSAPYSITMGCGVINGGSLINDIPNSLMIGFNSTIPTFFVGAANGTGTTGNVGIGTSTPDPAYKLDVCGTIRAKEVRVNTTGCDFVFDSSYVLMPLVELEKFVDSTKHLPNIPTAQQMETTNGVGLGQMNSLYLQKIEELTLYDIDLKKQNDLMQAEIDLMKKELEELRKEK